MAGATKEQREDKVRKRAVTEIFRYRWIENVPRDMTKSGVRAGMK